MSSLFATSSGKSPSRVPKLPWWKAWCRGPTLTVTRVNVVLLQFVASLACLSFWAAHHATEGAWNKVPPVRNHTEATFKLFAVYVVTTPLWTLCVLLDIYRQGTIISSALFEMTLVGAFAAYNGYLIPPILADGASYRVGTFSVVYFAVQIAALIITLIICCCSVLALLIITIDNHFRFHRPDVWLSGIRDFQWYGYPAPAGAIESDSPPLPICVRLLIGRSRGLGIQSGFYRPLNQFLWNHTVFRRVVGVEPIWLSIVRGSVSMAFLIGILAYAVIQCIKLPLVEDAGTLPVRPRELNMWSRDPSVTPLENITVAFTAYSPLVGNDWRDYTQGVQPLVQIFDPDGTSRTCASSFVASDIGGPSMWVYNCSGPAPIPSPFGTNEYINGDHDWLRTLQKWITITMDWTAVTQNGGDFTQVVALAGMDTVIESPFRPKDYPSVLQFQHPSYVMMKMGQHLKVQVEEYSVLKRRLNFIDVLGIASSPQARIYHPITSIQIVEGTPDPNPAHSSVTFYPGFGLVGQHVLEEYREYTVLAGLGSTGGLYAILDLIFGILFGRPLVAIIVGSKYISPFGLFVSVFGGPAMRRKLKRRYPHLYSDDSVKRSFSTSDFLHDFVLNFGTGVVKPTRFASPPPSPVRSIHHQGSAAASERARYERLAMVDDNHDFEWTGKPPGMAMGRLGKAEEGTATMRTHSEEYPRQPDFDPWSLELVHK